MRALHTATTGMAAQELNVQVISNNIANLRTTGYKRQQAHFQDLLYENFRRAGSATSDQNTVVPAGIELGSGVKTSSTARVMNQGNLASTEKEYDVAIRGDGFFKIRMPDGRTGYTGGFGIDELDSGRGSTREGPPGGSGLRNKKMRRQATPAMSHRELRATSTRMSSPSWSRTTCCICSAATGNRCAVSW